jgi:hypothetical protein
MKADCRWIQVENVGDYGLFSFAHKVFRTKKLFPFAPNTGKLQK